MNRLQKLLFCLLILVNSIFAQSNEDIEKVKKIYAPDKRTAVFEIKYNPTSNALIGKTNNLSAKEAVLAKFFSVSAIDSIQFLPDSVSKFEHKAIVNVSVANLRSNPEESAELASQILLGTPLNVLEKLRGWYRVQSPDQYIGWIDGSTITQISKINLEIYKNAQKVIFTKPFGFAKEDSSDEAHPVRDLVFGNIIRVLHTGRKHVELVFPDGKNGFVEKNDIMDTETWRKTRNAAGNEIVKNAYNFIGIPYLWGGTSFKGVDCSGSTRMAYFTQGMLLPRDASQQALKGQIVNTENNFESLKPGDLLFFGNTQTLKVSHVALWVGNLSYLHSSGMVQINSFDKNSSFFDEYNLKRLLFVKRIEPEEIKLEGKNLYKF